jgi:hypothetical protein
MKRIIRLTETDLTRIVKRVLSESDNCEEDYKNFECPKGTIRGESAGYTNVCGTAQIMAQNNWMKSKGLSSYNFSNISIVDSIQCNGKCIACINEPGTKVKPEKIKMKDLKESFQSKSDLSRIVKKVINEQIGWIEIVSSLPETGQDVYGITGSIFPSIKTDYERSFSNIFYWAKSKPHGSVPDYKAKIWKLYNAMNGMGTWENDVTSVLGSLQNINQLSTLINNWKTVTESSDSLYSWLVGDMDEEEMCKSFGEWAKKYFVSTNSKMVS